MFYCEPCRENKEWPKSFSRSEGLCEICGLGATCYDVPSRMLPDPVQTIRDKVNDQYEIMEDARSQLEELRKECPHPDVKTVDYMWRVGSTIPAEICAECDEVIKTEFQDIDYKITTSEVSCDHDWVRTGDPDRQSCRCSKCDEYDAG